MLIFCVFTEKIFACSTTASMGLLCRVPGLFLYSVLYSVMLYPPNSCCFSLTELQTISSTISLFKFMNVLTRCLHHFWTLQCIHCKTFMLCLDSSPESVFIPKGISIKKVWISLGLTYLISLLSGITAMWSLLSSVSRQWLYAFCPVCSCYVERGSSVSVIPSGFWCKFSNRLTIQFWNRYLKNKM